MAASKRIKTKYPGIFYRESERIGGSGIEKIFYAVFKRDGKVVETKIGRQYADDMTAARAAMIRAELIEGKRETRKEMREKQDNEVEHKVWTIGLLWEEYKRRKPDLKGIRTDQNRFDKHLSCFANFLPEQVTSTVVDNFRLSLAKKSLSPGTIRNVLELLRRILSFGQKKELLSPQQIVAHFEMPRLNNERTEDLSPEQLANLIKAIDNTRHKKAGNMMLLALYTGMRRGEMFNLKWDHIDWEHGFINLVGQDDGLGAKSGRIERIPLNEMAAQLLSSVPKTDSPYVFPGKKGKRLVDIRKQADAIKKDADLPPDFRPFHGLRHAYASMLASSGQVSMYELQKLMTHKSPAMTQRYAHLRDEALKAASSVIDTTLKNIQHR